MSQNRLRSGSSSCRSLYIELVGLPCSLLLSSPSLPARSLVSFHILSSEIARSVTIPFFLVLLLQSKTLLDRSPFGILVYPFHSLNFVLSTFRNLDHP